MAILKASGALSLQAASYYKNLTTCLQGECLTPNCREKIPDHLPGAVDPAGIMPQGNPFF